jgi:uncharacterized protein
VTPTDPLLALQDNDSLVDKLRLRRDALESGSGLAAARARADDAERAGGELRLQLDEIGRDQLRFEHEIDSMAQKIASEEKRLFDGSIANAKELDSIRHEVENLRKRKTDREDELLVLLEQREDLEALATAAEIEAAAVRNVAEETAATTADELLDVTSELEARTAERQQLAAALDPDLLELYEDLRRTKKGVGAAALIDGVCQGCHEQLSAVELDRLKRSDGIKRCEHCRRILVF